MTFTNSQARKLGFAGVVLGYIGAYTADQHHVFIGLGLTATVAVAALYVRFHVVPPPDPNMCRCGHPKDYHPHGRCYGWDWNEEDGDWMCDCDDFESEEE